MSQGVSLTKAQKLIASLTPMENARDLVFGTINNGEYEVVVVSMDGFRQVYLITENGSDAFLRHINQDEIEHACSGQSLGKINISCCTPMAFLVHFLSRQSWIYGKEKVREQIAHFLNVSDPKEVTQQAQTLCLNAGFTQTSVNFYPFMS